MEAFGAVVSGRFQSEQHWHDRRISKTDRDIWRYCDPNDLVNAARTSTCCGQARVPQAVRMEGNQRWEEAVGDAARVKTALDVKAPQERALLSEVQWWLSRSELTKGSESLWPQKRSDERPELGRKRQRSRDSRMLRFGNAMSWRGVVLIRHQDLNGVVT